MGAAKAKPGRMTPKRVPFKRCSCGKTWGTREDFLGDPAVGLHGYMVHFDALTEGLFLFVHGAAGCETSLALTAGDFADLYEGEIFERRVEGTDACPGYCLKKNLLGPCPVACECAYVREVLQIVRDWPKSGDPG